MFRPFSIRPSSGLTWWTKEEKFSSPRQTWWWPYRKGPKHVVYLLTPYTVIKCCVLTHPPDIILIFDLLNGSQTQDCQTPKKLGYLGHKNETRIRKNVFKSHNCVKVLLFTCVWSRLQWPQTAICRNAILPNLKVSHPRCVVKIQVREENPILYSHKTQLNIKLRQNLGKPNQQPAQARKQLQPANRSHRITHQQTSPILPQTRSRYIPPTPSTQ